MSLPNPDVHAVGLTDHGVGPQGDRLFAGDHDPAEEKRTLTVDAAHSLIRGCLLGRLAADGKVVLFDAAGAGGAEIAHGVLAHDIDATVAEQEVVVYTRGTFSRQEIVAQTAGLAAIDQPLEDAMRDVGLYVRKTLRAGAV